MLKNGEIVEIDGNKYEVIEDEGMPCKQCELKDCYKSKGLDALKAKHFALSCVELIPLSACFKKVVEQ